MSFRTALAILSMLAMVACAPVQPRGYGGGYAPANGGGESGTVMNIQSIGQRNTTSGGGAVLGAVIGGALGNQVGKGDGRTAATIAGAVAGGVIGNNVERRNNQYRTVYRILVRMDRSGRTYTFEQPDAYGLRRGDPVYIDNGYVVPGW
ncbi:glycine zipper 2TM domain-containing protein [Dokdonella sp.]|uniref:glycine zipper 2TM domain-containing protein n=1 Tax=Dokdonella sp. TaxID=2291710 RepID=UPI003527386E